MGMDNKELLCLTTRVSKLLNIEKTFMMLMEMVLKITFGSTLMFLTDSTNPLSSTPLRTCTTLEVDISQDTEESPNMRLNLPQGMEMMASCSDLRISWPTERHLEPSTLRTQDS